MSKQFIIRLALGFCVILNATALLAHSEALNISARQWRDDIAFLRRELPNRHKNAFHHISRERFESEIDALDKNLDHMNDDEVFSSEF